MCRAGFFWKWLCFDSYCIHQISFYVIQNIPLKPQNFHRLSLAFGCGAWWVVQLTQVVEKTQIHEVEQLLEKDIWGSQKALGRVVGSRKLNHHAWWCEQPVGNNFFSKSALPVFSHYAVFGMISYSECLWNRKPQIWTGIIWNTLTETQHALCCVEL